MKKHLLTIVLMLSMVTAGFSQLAIKPSLIIPSGVLGSVMKSNIAIEVSEIDEFDGHWRFRYGGYLGLLTGRKDTFYTYMVQEDYQGTHILPGYYVVHPSLLLYGNAGVDFSIINDKKVTPYIGASLLGGSMILNYDEAYFGGIDESNFLAGGLLIGLEMRIGIQKELNKSLDIFSEFSSSGYLVTETGFFSHYNFGIGIIF